MSEAPVRSGYSESAFERHFSTRKVARHGRGVGRLGSPLDSPVGNFISDRSDADAKYGAEVATDARASPRDDTSDLDVTIAGCVFPLEDYLRVAEGLCRHPSWMVYPKQLASCLIAACEIVHTGDVEAERKSVELTRLYREMTPSAHSEKCVVFDDVVNWDRNIQLDILVACKALAELVSVKLSAAQRFEPRAGRRTKPAVVTETPKRTPREKTKRRPRNRTRSRCSPR